MGVKADWRWSSLLVDSTNATSTNGVCPGAHLGHLNKYWVYNKYQRMQLGHDIISGWDSLCLKGPWCL